MNQYYNGKLLSVFHLTINKVQVPLRLSNAPICPHSPPILCQFPFSDVHLLISTPLTLWYKHRVGGFVLFLVLPLAPSSQLIQTCVLLTHFKKWPSSYPLCRFWPKSVLHYCRLTHPCPERGPDLTLCIFITKYLVVNALTAETAQYSKSVQIFTVLKWKGICFHLFTSQAVP